MLKKFLEKYKVNIILETLLTNIMKTLLDVSLAFERAPMLVLLKTKGSMVAEKLRQQLGSLVYICKWCTTIRKEIEMYFSP
jgi:hypothetical protein